ncbi:MAG TPA: 5-formyltetrahydrofolate cyclo-ligase [Terriglobales bacterium]|nr:5-formyltetrahydrofolate cyclo-ligase [Terriglobales bacterium]
MGESKIALRAAATSRRSALSQQDVLSRSCLIQARVCRFPEYLSCRSVALYAAIQNEVMTDNLRDDAWRRGKRVFYPTLRAGAVAELVPVESSGELRMGALDIPEPSSAAVLPDDWRQGLLVVVPGLAFDPMGNRLGRGRGWYDRLLKKLGHPVVTVGLAYDFQIVDRVPVEAWDERVAFVFTEIRQIDCREARKALSLP